MNFRIKQRGVTLIELIVALGIMAAVTLGVNQLINTYSEDTRSSITALHIKRVGAAANSYIKNNYAAISSVATATNPALIRVSDLVTGGYLPAGYSIKNQQSQDTCVLVLEPSANNLTAIAVTEGGSVIDDITLGQIAATIGGEGGAIYSTAVTTIRGAMGGYSFLVGNFANANHLGMKCDGVTAGAVTLGAGHPVMALWFADGNSTSSTLYRDSVPGNPSLNTMNTPIIMGAGTVQVVDGACTTIGMLGRDNTGKVLMCDGALWKQQGASVGYWKDPVNNIASLPVCDAAAAYQTRVVTTPSVGSGPRAYNCNGSGTWQPLAVDDSGNLTIGGTLTAVNVTASGKTTTGLLQVNTVAVEGTACPTNGLVARNAAGLLLSCQYSVWKVNGGITRSGTYTTAINGACNNGSYAIGSQTQTVCNGYSTSCTTCTSPTTIDCLNFVPVCSTFCTSSSTGTTTTCANP